MAKMEVVFFKFAFSCIDERKKTNCFEKYSALLSQGDFLDDQIDWGQIPGLMTSEYCSNDPTTRYITAVHRVTEILMEIFEEDPEDREWKKNMRLLAALSNCVYQIHQREFDVRDVEMGGYCKLVASCNAWNASSALLANFLPEVPKYKCTVGEVFIGILLFLIVIGWSSFPFWISYLR